MPNDVFIYKRPLQLQKDKDSTVFTLALLFLAIAMMGFGWAIDIHETKSLFSSHGLDALSWLIASNHTLAA